MWSDLKIACRALLRSPGHTLVVSATLGVGLGVSTALCGLFMTTLWPTLGYAEPERLVRIELSAKGQAMNTQLFASRYEAYRDSSAFSDIAISATEMMNLQVDEKVWGVYGCSVSANYFSVLGVQPAKGRAFRTEEMRAGQDTVAIVTHAFARGLQADGEVLGREIDINRRKHRIIGVMPESWPPIVQLPNGAVMVPLIMPDVTKTPWFYFGTVARLKPGVSREQAEAELRTRALPPVPPAFSWMEGYEPVVTPAFELGSYVWMRRYVVMLWTSIAAVGCLHLLACVNAGSLLMMRAFSRRREIALRLALGGSRWRVLRPFVLESGLVVLLAMTLAFVVARWGMPALMAWMNGNRIAEALRFGLRTEAVWFLVLLAALTGLLTTLLPLWQVTRLPANAVIKEGGHLVGEAPGLRRARATLVVIEAALAVLLLTGAGLLLRTFERLHETKVGYETMQRYVVRGFFHTRLPALKPEERLDRFERVAQALAALPGVRGAAATSAVAPRNFATPRKLKVFDARGATEVDVAVDFNAVSPEFIELVGIPLRAGRTLAQARRGDAPALVVNEAFARKVLQRGRELGAQVAINANQRWEIIGIVGDTQALRDEVRPRVYYPIWQRGPTFPMEFLVNTAGEASPAFEAELRRAVYAADPDLAVMSIERLERAAQMGISNERFAFALLKVLSACALNLAMIGLFAMVAFATAERRSEFAVRLTLGATPASVMRLVLLRGVALAAGGVLLGLGAAAGLSQFIATLFYEIKPLDPLTYGAVGLIMLLVALPACGWPAWRASRVDPARVLRDE